MEDLSDRELERFLQENNAGKWFCGFELCERTPDHTVFCDARKRIGTKTKSTKPASKLKIEIFMSNNGDIERWLQWSE